jgi:DNA-binding CsgD family transcriptional regulator/PAS domain-containing protein
VERFERLGRTMSRHKDLITLINLIYEAVLDSDLWPSVLMALADAVGATQIAMLSMDRRANVVTTFAPRLDPDLLACWQKYWAFPVLARASLRPTGEIYTLDSLMPKFVATRFFNEFWQPAQLGLSAAGANLLVGDQFSALIFFSNAPDKEFLTTQQMHVFEVVLRHLTRAARISRRLWELEIEQIAAVERLESLQEGALLVDASGKVIRANDAAKAMLDNGDGIFLDNGRIAAAGSEISQKLIASCAQTCQSLGGPGGEFKIPREHPRSPLHVTVTSLRSKTQLADVPWIGVEVPVAIVTVRDPDVDWGQQEINLRHRFGLTAAEARLAAEILKGDGRAAAARRRGISTATAKSHLSSIFEKTGTHRQAELIRLLLDAVDEDKIET